MNIWIMTDMEGLAGVDDWSQCYPEQEDEPGYLQALNHLVGDVNAAVLGALDAGAHRIYVCDGHGRNRFRGFDRAGGLHPQATQVSFASRDPVRLAQLDEQIDAVVMIGQHAMAGTINGFLDHTQIPRTLVRLSINDRPMGELGQFAFYAGHYNVPLIYASGDQAMCDEARDWIDGVATTTTKRGTGWNRCALIDPIEVRQAIRRDIAQALSARQAQVCQTTLPAVIQAQWACSEQAEPFADVAGVQRLDGQTLRWRINDLRDVFNWPSARWHPQSCPQSCPQSSPDT